MSAAGADTRTWTGWDGRVLVLAVVALAGVPTAGMAVLTGVVGATFVIGAVAGWRPRRAPVTIWGGRRSSVTLLSVVVPVYKVQGYLRQCLDSLLEQPFTDFEVVAVDDCSPDGSGDILAEYAARDPRIKVLTLEQNVGLGRARNAGLDVAVGEYVWFLDSDDWLAPGLTGGGRQAAARHRRRGPRRRTGTGSTGTAGSRPVRPSTPSAPHRTSSRWRNSPRSSTCCTSPGTRSSAGIC